MDEVVVALLAAGMLVAAFGYAAVGHGGASAYIAAMALAGIAPQEMRPVALLLNVVVSSIATWKFWRAGHFHWRLFWPFAAVSVPLAYVGGAITLPGQAYKVLVGAVLLYAAWQLWRSGRRGDEMRPVREPQASAALSVYDVVGPICESADFLARDRRPDRGLREGAAALITEFAPHDVPETAFRAGIFNLSRRHCDEEPLIPFYNLNVSDDERIIQGERRVSL